MLLCIIYISIHISYSVWRVPWIGVCNMSIFACNIWNAPTSFIRHLEEIRQKRSMSTQIQPIAERFRFIYCFFFFLIHYSFLSRSHSHLHTSILHFLRSLYINAELKLNWMILCCDCKALLKGGKMGEQSNRVQCILCTAHKCPIIERNFISLCISFKDWRRLPTIRYW